MTEKILKGISAGLMIAIGGSVFLACENRYVGAVMFSVGLLAICYKGYYLFTGKVGFLSEKHGKEEISLVLLCLLGNCIATTIVGWLVRFANPALQTAALTVCEAKLGQTLAQGFVRAIFCGVLMYMAVSIYRDQKSIAGILFCVPVFILAGFEHSIADMFYFAASGIVSFRAFVYLWVIVLGNSVGGMLLPKLNAAGKKGESRG